jgi:hypothetical protein
MNIRRGACFRGSEYGRWSDVSSLDGIRKLRPDRRRSFVTMLVCGIIRLVHALGFL